MFRRARTMRRQLQRLGFSPTCPLCGKPCGVLDFAPHTKQCSRDLASLSLEAIGRRLLALREAPPSSQQYREIARLQDERHECWTTLLGLDSLGRGRIDTGAPGWPDDGMPF